MTERSLLKSLTKPTQGSRPAFLLAGLGGQVLTFRPLAQRLAPKCHLTGVLYPVHAGGSSHCTSISDLAKDMAAPLQDYHDPIILIGYSIGGAVAYQIAQERHKHGLATAVILIDTRLNALRRKRGRIFLLARRILVSTPRKLFRLKGTKGKRDVWTPDDPRLREFVEDSKTAIAAFQPHKSDTIVVLIRTKSYLTWKRWIRGQYWPSRTHGWSKVVPVVHVVHGPGDHLTIVNEDNRDALGLALDQALNIAAEAVSLPS